MIVALLLGRKGSVGFPGKNTYNVLGHPLMFYPLNAALKAKGVDEVYISTDDEQLMEIARKNGAQVIVRPPELCTKEALGEDAYVHGYKVIKEKLEKQGKKIEMMVLLFCNAPMVTPEKIEEGIEALRRRPDYDSAVTVSKYNMWSPIRARKEGKDGLLHPFVSFEVFGDPKNLNCDRDSQGDVWYFDVSLSIVRPHCLENLKDGLLPQKWMGQKIYPLKQWGGLDVDYEWQIPQVKYWLKYRERELEKKQKKVGPKKNLDYMTRMENTAETRAGFLRLDKNENILGLEERFLQKIKDNITSEFITMYPEVYQTYDKISKWLKVDRDKVYVTAGSDAGIKATFEVFVDEGDEVVILDPTYAMYYVYADMFGATLKRVKFNEKLELSKQDIIKAITDKTKLMCIANPNSPTGTLLSQKDLEEIIQYAQDRAIIVLVDEAYYPFHNETCISKIDKFNNLILTRSFTKAYGLGCARLGFAASNRNIIALLKKFRPMYEINSFAVLLANLVLDEQKMIADNMKKFEEGKNYLEETLNKVKIPYFKSYANFILIDAGSNERAKKIEQELAKRKILVRTGFRQSPLDRCVRASIGTKEQMKQFTDALTEAWNHIKMVPK